MPFGNAFFMSSIVLYIPTEAIELGFSPIPLRALFTYHRLVLLPPKLLKCPANDYGSSGPLISNREKQKLYKVQVFTTIPINSDCISPG